MIEPKNKRFIYCPDCRYLMCTIDSTSEERPLKYFRCSRCGLASTIHQVVVTKYPDAVPVRPKNAIKIFRGYSRKFNKEEK